MMQDKQLAQQHLLRWLLLLSSILLLIGFVSPIMTITQFWVVSHSVSIISGVWRLLNDGQIGLFVVVVAFSIMLPIAKIIVLFRLLQPARQNDNASVRLLKMMHDYGRWAMLDVLVVAVLLVSVKLGAIATIEIHTGLYIFGTAVLLIMFITHRVARQLRSD